MSKKEEDSREKVAWARLSVFSNTILTIFKLVAGLAIFSISVVSEGIHSSIDLLASIIAAYSVQKASMPADKDHEFGHGKYESLSCAAEAVLIFVAAGIIIYESCLKLYFGPTILSVDLGIVVMLIAVIVNVFVSRKLFQVAHKHESMAIDADAYHLLTDVYTSVGVLVGLSIIRLGQWFGIQKIEYLDPIIALCVAVVIIKAAYDLTKRGVEDLIDHRLTDREEKIIKNTLREHYSQFVEFHELRSRKAGNERHIDLHLVLGKDMHVSEAHALCDHIEKDIKTRLPSTHVLIHMEPCDGLCKRCDLVITCAQRKRKIRTVRKSF